MCFNNTTSPPLLLVESLEATGILQRHIITDEKPSDAIERAKSYFLVYAIVGNCLTFTNGPRLLDAGHAPDEPIDSKTDTGYHQENGHHENVENDNANEQASLRPNVVRRDVDEVEDREY
jgi:auxin efflux carrier family protein